MINLAAGQPAADGQANNKTNERNNSGDDGVHYFLLIMTVANSNTTTKLRIARTKEAN